MTFGCTLHGEAHKILEGGEWCLLPKVVGHLKLLLEAVPIKFITPLPFDLH
jgi:hypothetical protein